MISFIPHTTQRRRCHYHCPLHTRGHRGLELHACPSYNQLVVEPGFQPPYSGSQPVLLGRAEEGKGGRKARITYWKGHRSRRLGGRENGSGELTKTRLCKGKVGRPGSVPCHADGSWKGRKEIQEKGEEGRRERDAERGEKREPLSNSVVHYVHTPFLAFSGEAIKV